MSRWEITDEFAAEWNRVRNKVDGAAPHAHVQPGVDGKELPQAVRVKIDSAAVDGGKYRYVAYVVYGALNNSPTDVSLSDVGDVSTSKIELWNLSEISGNYASPLLASGDVVLAVLQGFNKNLAVPIYVTDAAPIPVAQYQFMVIQAVAQNMMGCDFVMASPALS